MSDSILALFFIYLDYQFQVRGPFGNDAALGCVLLGELGEGRALLCWRGISIESAGLGWELQYLQTLKYDLSSLANRSSKGNACLPLSVLRGTSFELGSSGVHLHLPIIAQLGFLPILLD